jgi:hypothetical protein
MEGKRRRRRRTVLTVKHDLRKDGYTGDVTLVPLADFHIGDPNTDVKLIKKLIKQVEETDNCYTVLNGDLMNTAIASSVSDTYDEVLKPSDQLKKAVKYFGTLAEQGKILAVTDGNHERRISRSVGVDMTELMCAELHIPHLYSAGDAILCLRVGADTTNTKRKGKAYRPFFYTVLARHGAGGGALLGGKVNRLQRFSDVADVDLYIGSHTHNDIVFHDSIFRVDRQHSTSRAYTRTYVNTPSTLNYGGYGEVGGYRPQSNEHWPIVTLHGDRWDITVQI